MANKALFQSAVGRLPAVDTINQHGSGAYAYQPKHKLAQLVMTGCFNQTFYANAEMQLQDIMELVNSLDTEFIVKAAVYARQKGHMKDMPAFLVAVLATRQTNELERAFSKVIDNGKMLRNFVQIIRSGITGRKSLGSKPKHLVQNWLNTATEKQLLNATVGNSPSLADVVKMVHPKPTEAWRDAFFGWLIGKPVVADLLPESIKSLLAFRNSTTDQLPDVPFQMLTSDALTDKEWAIIADRMGWQALRINLNTLARQGAFKIAGTTEKVAKRLADAEEIAKAKVYPYQLLAAYCMASNDVPLEVKEALQDAMELALTNVPELTGNVVVCPDVSGSMQSPVTGYRAGATTSVRCIDVAALVAAAIVCKNTHARVLPFEQKVVNAKLNPRDSVITNATKLAKIGGGGTNCSAPLALLVAEKAKVDTVIFISDNESWVDGRRYGATETMRQWELLKKLNPKAKLICIDIQPYGTTQAKDREDILNVGGFGDSVFDVIAQFVKGEYGAGYWVQLIEATQV